MECAAGYIAPCNIIPVPSTPAIEKYYWWCPTCKEEVDPTRVTFQECHDVCGTHVEALSITPASEGKFNNALQADALDWDTRNIEPQPTSEIMLEQIEALSVTFYNKYSGKWLTPSEVMELHKSEYWGSVSSLIEAPLREEIAELKAEIKLLKKCYAESLTGVKSRAKAEARKNRIGEGKDEQEST